MLDLLVAEESYKEDATFGRLDTDPYTDPYEEEGGQSHTTGQTTMDRAR